ncbi:MAG: biotin transporter BioY [Candidatus Limnocylindria bacterium]
MTTVPRVRGPQLTLADVLPWPHTAPAVRDVLLVLGGAGLTAGAAQLAISLPWSPVPYTFQTFAVLLVGTALGTWRGTAAMAIYVLAGAIGLPVYAEGTAGIGQLLGITGGYLAGFVLAALIVGRLAELGWDRTVLRAAGLMLAGTLLIYAVGVPVLAVTTGMDLPTAAYRGAGVFLPWDLLKVIVAAGALPLAWRVVGRGAARR